MAGEFPCDDANLLGNLSLAEIGGGEIGNDIWGWTDPSSGREIAIMGKTNGTAFVDVTDGTNPRFLGMLPTQTDGDRKFRRDIKVYRNYAFIVSEHIGHNMQVFDLTRLRGIGGGEPQTFTADTVYEVGGSGNTHNLDINEATGFAYLVGTSTCNGGLHMVKISNLLSRTGYPTAAYTHQGRLTEDGKWFVFDDELDELSGTAPAARQTTYTMNVESLTHPGEVRAARTTPPREQCNKEDSLRVNYSGGILRSPRRPRGGRLLRPLPGERRPRVRGRHLEQLRSLPRRQGRRLEHRPRHLRARARARPLIRHARGRGGAVRPSLTRVTRAHG